MANVPSRSPIRFGSLAAPARSRVARRAFLVAAAAAMLALLFGAAVARADNVASDVVVGGNDTIVRGGSTVWRYRINANLDSGETAATQCNAADGTPAVVTINSPAGVTVSPRTLTFTQCGVFQPVTISSSTVGRHLIFPTIADAGRGVYGTGLATNFLTVVAPTNTAPVVTVAGVAEGAAYEAGSVPTAVCNVVDLEDGTSSFVATLSGINGSLSGLGLGSQTASCTYRDRGGLSSGATATYWIVDTVPPVLNTPGDLIAEAVDANGAVVAFAVSATDSVDPAPAVACSRASGDTFGLGPTAVDCTATDAAGNVASGGFTVTVVDTTAPSLTLPGDLYAEATGADGAFVSFAVSAADAVDPAPVVACSPASGDRFAIGVTSVACTATDAAGNGAAGGFTVTVGDMTAPTLNLPGDLVAEATGPDGAAVTFSVSATDSADPVPVVDCAPASGGTFAFGVTSVACTATDAAGNVASGSFTVTVQDTTAPVFGDVPGDVAAEADGPGGTVVEFAVPTATDLVDGTIQADCAPVPGASFALGNTTVTCTATDSRGNAASVGFTVSVGDTTPPVLSLPDVIVVDGNGAGTPGIASVASGPGGAIVTFDVSAFDNVDGPVSVVCTPASGSFFPVGRTTVLCEATDSAGNTAAGTFVVEVSGEPIADTTPPSIECAKPDGAWHAGDVEVGCIATDEGSGFAGGEMSQLFSLWTAVPAGTATADAATNSVGVCDAAGNCATAGPSVGHKVDKKAPTDIALKPNIPHNSIYILFRFSPTGPIYGSGPAKPTCTALDEGSGLASCTVAGHSKNIGIHTLTITATDKVGNATVQKRTYAIVLLTWTGTGWKITVSSAAPTSAPTPAALTAAFDATAGSDAWVAALRSMPVAPGGVLRDGVRPIALASGDASVVRLRQSESADLRRPVANG